jgi:hypothetical protein
LHQITDNVEDRLRQDQEETMQATQALAQAQEYLLEQHRNAEQEKLSIQEKLEEEKAVL